MNEHTGETAAAFSGLLNALQEAANEYITEERGIVEEIDIIEGFRYILHMLTTGIDFYLEGDPDRPEFIRMVSPTRKYMGDNPDAHYYFVRIRGDRSYRITGRKGNECYLSFTIHGRMDDGRLGAAAEPVLADVSDRELAIAPDGSFEVILSPDERPGNWIRLDPNAACVITRHYFELERSAQTNPDVEVKLQIEPAEVPPVRPPLVDSIMARRINDVTAYIRGGTVELPVLFEAPVPFVSPTPNVVPQPTSFRRSGQASWGAVDVAYAMGLFRIGPEEALVIEGEFPKCTFANIVLWNRHMQTFEYRDHRVSLNRNQTVLEPDGSYRIVIAHRDPGVPNWLETEGHNEGIMFWRFMLPVETPSKPKCTLVPLSQVTTGSSSVAE